MKKAESSDTVLPNWLIGYWGKARPRNQDGPGWHPLAYHSLDVAAALLALLDARPVTRRMAIEWLGGDAAQSTTLLAFLAMVHDLGKFGLAFQAQHPDAWHLAATHMPEARRLAQRTHPEDSILLWTDEALGFERHVNRHRFCGDATVWLDLVKAAFGHHGRPVGGIDVGRRLGAGEAYGPSAKDAWAFVDRLFDLLSVDRLQAPALLDQRRGAVVHGVAGLLVLADWVGSNQRFFPYTPPTMPLKDYWALAQSRAGRAAEALGLAETPAAPLTTFAALTGITDPPSPLQAWTIHADLLRPGTLVTLEDVTGAGKTEAAQMIVHRWMAAGLVNGAYWAMPTQATANAMYGRQRGTLRALFRDDTAPSLALAHGQADLVTDWRVVRMSADGEPRARDVARDELPATQACAEYLSHDRRVSLLADIGAGTIDQALLAALPTRFNTLRRAALAGKALVLDEVHAYDAYMQTEIEALLTSHVALGGCAILLSATLRKADLDRIASGWMRFAPGTATRASLAKGASIFKRPQTADAEAVSTSLAPAADEPDYPLATVVNADRRIATHIPAAPRSYRQVPLRAVNEFDAVVQSILTMASRGAAVCWIRNTVNDVLLAKSALEEQGAEVIVFHARYVQCDRQQIEREVVARFGKVGTPAGRRGRILLASPVVEQSLDVCFDYLVSDLAPIDLILQRMGRLRRLKKFDRFRPVDVPFEAMIFGPVPDDDAPARWLKDAAWQGSSAVYQNDALLWRTARVMQARGVVKTPAEVRSLIETSYDYSGPLPDGLRKAESNAIGEEHARRSFGRSEVLPCTALYDASEGPYLDDDDSATRLGGKRITLRVARVVEGRLSPWSRTATPNMTTELDQSRAWSLSELTLRENQLPKLVDLAPRWRAAIDAIRASWSTYEATMPLLVLESTAPAPATSPTIWSGTLIDGTSGSIWTYRYQPDTGLSIERPA